MNLFFTLYEIFVVIGVNIYDTKDRSYSVVVDSAFYSYIINYKR